ncbi:MAG: bifunctional nicotinamidase/pyrazinamidase [Alphaproteobacteria bacterium]|nr:bifunctional nicotinamidase/pyrazinamidase [Alphaproteobacteria bacterium]
MMRRRRVLAGVGGAVAASTASTKKAAAQRARPSPPPPPGPGDALIVVDVQNDFIPGGALAVPRGDEVVPVINHLAKAFPWVVLTQDWHGPGHASFASSYPGKKPFEVVKLPYGNQVLWPDHCVQGTEGAAFHRDLAIPHAQLVIRKGYNPSVDSYSAFIEADRKSRTGLDAWLKAQGIKRVFCCGLATDFCVAWTAQDARKLGFQAVVIEDACRAIDLDGSLARAWEAMAKAGVVRSSSATIAV